MSTRLVRHLQALVVVSAFVGATAVQAQSAVRPSVKRGAMATKVVAERADSVRATPSNAPAFTRLTAAMDALAAHSQRFVRMPEQRPESITLVDVRNVFRYSDEQKKFEEALATHERDIVAMRSNLQGSLALRDLLYDRQLSMQQVIAVEVNPDGRTGTVYFRPE